MKKNLLFISMLALVWGCGDPRVGKSYHEVLYALRDTVNLGNTYVESPADSTVCFLSGTKCLRRNIYTDVQRVVWDLDIPTFEPYLALQEGQQLMVFYKYEVEVDEYGSTDNDLIMYIYDVGDNFLAKKEFLCCDGYYSMWIDKDVKPYGKGWLLTTQWNHPSKEVRNLISDEMSREIRFVRSPGVGFGIVSDSTFLRIEDYGFRSELLEGDYALYNAENIIVPGIIEECFIPIDIYCLHPVQYLTEYQENPARFKREYKGDFIKVEGVVSSINEYQRGLLDLFESGYTVTLEIEYMATDKQTHTISVRADIPENRSSEIMQLTVGQQTTLYGNVDIVESQRLLGTTKQLVLRNATTKQPRRSYAEAKRNYERAINYAP